MTPMQQLVAACFALVVLTLLVGIRMLLVRIGEMRTRRIHPQSVATSVQKSQRFEDTRASDNYNHLFELPVLFYALCLAALATGHVPGWLPVLAWLFVVSRVVHSAIQCTYNRVMHRFAAFVAGFALVIGMWAGFAASYLSN